MNGEYQSTEYAADIYNPTGLNFKSFIQSKMKAVYGKQGSRTITAAELAEALGLSTKVFHEILNGRRSGPDRRDFVIALCAELGLDAGETDEAISLFPAQLRPLSAADARDRQIIRFLNADFDVDINCAALNRQLSDGNLSPLKIRHRNQNASDGRRNGMEEKIINWEFKTEAERQRYNYYTSLDYDNRTATVLALYTYGARPVTGFRIEGAYDALINGSSYPREDPSPDEVYCSAPHGGRANLAFKKGAFASKRGINPTPARRASIDPMDLDRCCKISASPPPSQPGKASSNKAFDARFLYLEDDDATDEYQPIEEKGFRDSLREYSSTFRMTTNTASVGSIPAWSALRNC